MAWNVRAEQQPARLSALLGAPLRALLQAQAMAELHTLDYIVDVGMDDDRRQASTLEFDLVQPVADPQRPGQVEPTPTRVSVPILSILQTPSLRIAEANIEMAVNITEAVDPGEQAGRARPGAEGPERASAPRLELVGVIGSRVAARRLPSLSVSMRVESAEAPETYERLRRLLGDAMTAVPSEEREPDPKREA